ncbi:hypothetical protein B5S31_g5444 [[Candida] boidinii]|nr:hypothetical protein B5S31_g5444 [[Candida] boidinii]
MLKYSYDSSIIITKNLKLSSNFKLIRNFTINSKILNKQITDTDNNNNNDDLSHKYSSTLNLPFTEFPNRSDSKLIESVLKPQTTSNLYNWNLNQPLKDNDLQNLFILHDGPPYANGDLHIGHAMNKILKDMINRYELIINGKKIHYVPGWDCHGLPIELKALEKLKKQNLEKEKELKKLIKSYEKQEITIDNNNNNNNNNKNNKLESLKSDYELIKKQNKSSLTNYLNPLEIIKLAKDHAIMTQKLQSDSFEKMAILGDFKNPYLTLQKNFVINQLNIFKKFFDNGLIIRKEKPVYWGCENSTALAEGELEYNQNHISTAAYIKFPLFKISNNFNKILNSHKNLLNNIDINSINALIWTSTPWTLISNKAICINEEFEYTLLKDKLNNQFLIISKDLIDSVKNLSDYSKENLIETNIFFKGSDLIGCFYKNPLINDKDFINDKINIEFPILNGSHVTNTAGTGLVHTAPGHGNDDYLVCIKNNIKPYSPVDNYGKYNNDLPNSLIPLFQGKKVLGEGTKLMLTKLNEINMCFHIDPNYLHSYPYDWRSKKPIIIRSTPQWFIDVSKIKDDTCKSLIDQVEFYPERGSKRLISFIKTRNEWCISRQRSWGVPIPVLYRKSNNEPLLNDEVLNQIIKIIEIEDIDSWFDNSNEIDNISKWLPDSMKDKANEFYKGKDTMDVWFDSGSSWKLIENYLSEQNLLDQAIERGYLSNAYLEGSDQHRGWFQSSILTKMGTRLESEKIVLPYKEIITHGFTLDEKGEKMSKSLGNVISPTAVINGDKQKKIPALGIDGLRLWVAQSDYSNDVSIGPTILKHVADNIKKIRFTFKFLLGNLNEKNNDFNININKIEYNDLKLLDKLILSKLYKLEKLCLENIKLHNFSTIIRELNHFINVELSSIYFDIRKDSLYTDKLNSKLRRSTQTVFVEIFKTFIKILSPILPIITQEAWNHSPISINQKIESPFMEISKWSYINGLPKIYLNEKIEIEFNKIWEIRNKVKLLIDKANRLDKNVRNSLETSIYLNLNENSEMFQILNKYKDEIADFCVVSQFHLNKPIIENGEIESNYNYEFEIDDLSDLKESIKINVVKSDKLKCPRCWKFTREPQDDLCNRCEDVVKDL